MKDGLYRVEVLASIPANPDADTPNLNDWAELAAANDCAMITNKSGLFFAKLRPVKITAQPKKKESEGCYFCDNKRMAVVIPIDTEPPFLVPHLHALPAQKARYCFYCGRHLEKEATE